MPLPLIPLLAGVFLFGLTVHKFLLYPIFLSPLSKIPNAHWSSPISPIWILWTRFRCRENRSAHAAHLKHGPVVRLGPNELSVNDLNGVKTVYAGGFEKGQWYGIFDNYGVPCMFSTFHSRTHSARKRFISHIYSKSILHSSIPLHAQAHEILYSRLLPLLSTSLNNPIDIHEIWNATTMDFITSYLFGLSCASNFLQDATYRKHWLGLYHSRKTYPYFPQELPCLTHYLKRIGIHLVPRWVDAANAELEAWCKARCEAASVYLETTSPTTRSENPGDEPVVLSTLLAGIRKEEATKGTLSPLYPTTLLQPSLSVASEMIDHLAAGHETSGITLTYISYHLSKSPALQDLLRAELLSLRPNMLLSPGITEDRLPNSKDLDALPLLHAIVLETLRLRAAIPGGQPRMTPFPSCTIGEFTDIPGGVRVGAQAYSVHRNSDVFPDPERWDHERWLDDREEVRRERERWFWAFSSGGRMCVGSNYAMHEIKLVIAAVYSNFRTYVVDDTGIEQEDGYTCSPVGNRLILRFERAE